MRLLQAGIKDFVLVDTAGGFGGTWYWNRYPGFMCDVESYIYMPLLEKMDYISQQKYSTGYELRRYMEAIAEKYELGPKAMFSGKVDKMVWDEERREWVVNLTQLGQLNAPILTVRSSIVISSTGILNLPKMIGLPGILDYEGKSFHTSRWDYGCTGGTQADPAMVNLQEKRVGYCRYWCYGRTVCPRTGEMVYGALRVPADSFIC